MNRNMNKLILNVKQASTKQAYFSGVCQCCLLSANNLKNMLQIFTLENKCQTYIDMLIACFSIQILNSNTSEDKLYLICEQCVLKLEDSYLFRNQIEEVQRKLKQECNDFFDTSDTQLESEECSNDDYDDDFNDLKEENEKIETDKNHSNYSDVIMNSEDGGNIKRVDSKNPHQSSDRKIAEKPKMEIALTLNENKPKMHENSVKTSSILGTLNEQELALLKMKKKGQWSFVRRQRKNHGLPFEMKPSAVTCDICKESFVTHKLLIYHMAIHFPNHICDLCGKLFISKERLVAHMKYTHDDEKIACEICSKLLKKTSMPRHVRSHSGNNFVYVCHICPNRFTSYSSRMIHLREIHKLDQKKFKCKLCPKLFERSGYLSKHVRKVHHQEKKYSCSYCNRCFFTNTNLKSHMVTHTGQKDFQCLICYKAYGTKSTLSKHMKTHNIVE